jgi:Protein of unknown function (DUF3105)
MANKARQKQLQQRARQERAARQRQLIYVGVGVVALLVIVFAASKLLAQPTTAVASADSASAATCSAIQSPSDEGRAHLVPGQTPTYQSNPPSSGTHNPIPLPAGIYDSPVDVTMEVHSEEHGYIIVHYNGISQGEINQLKQIVSSDPRKLILSPYPNMPYKVSLTAWDHLQTCAGVNRQAISNFVAEFRDRGPENVP